MKIVPFQPGRQKTIIRGSKQYHPYLYRYNRKRYAGHGRKSFRTATLALKYARRWGEWAERYLSLVSMPHQNIQPRGNSWWAKIISYVQKVFSYLRKIRR